MEIIKRSNWTPKVERPVKKKCFTCSSEILVNPEDWTARYGLIYGSVNCPVCGGEIKKVNGDGAL